MARRPNLIVVRATDGSIHERWLAGAPRNFDLMVSYAGDRPGRFSQGVEYYHAMKGPQWPAHHALFTHYMKLLGDYQSVAVVCDDIDSNAMMWNRLFHICDWYGLDLVHPSVVGNGSTDVTRPQEETLLRYMSLVDSLAPVFARRVLERVVPTFASGVSEHDLPLQWSERLPWPAYRSAIADTVRVVRTLPTWGGSVRPAPEGREQARLRLVHENQ